MIFYNEVNVLSMSNEELAIRIKNGSAELVGELWKNTNKILYKLANAYYSRLQALLQTYELRKALPQLLPPRELHRAWNTQCYYKAFPRKALFPAKQRPSDGEENPA